MSIHSHINRAERPHNRRSPVMSTYTTPLSGVYAADPTHSSFGFAVKYMGVSTFRGTLNVVDARLEIGPGGRSPGGAPPVEATSIPNPDPFRPPPLRPHLS